MEQVYGVALASWICATAILGVVYFWKFAQPFSGLRGYIEELRSPWHLLVCGECLGTFLCSSLWLIVMSTDMVYITLFRMVGWLSTLGIYYLLWNLASSLRRPLS